MESNATHLISMRGTVAAGFAGAAEEELSDAITLDDFLIENKEASYMLKVRGDSMIGAGIHEGDLVIVERGGEPRDGDIVIAEIDGGWTVKYLRVRAGHQFLEAHILHACNAFGAVWACK